MTNTIDINAYLDRFKARMDAAAAKEAADFPHEVPVTAMVSGYERHFLKFREHEKWCLANCNDRFKFTSRVVGSSASPTAIARFKFASDRDAILFKMFWEEGA